MLKETVLLLPLSVRGVGGEGEIPEMTVLTMIIIPDMQYYRDFF